MLAGQVQAGSAAPVHPDGQNHQGNDAFGLHARCAQQMAIVIGVAGFKTGGECPTVFDELGLR